MSTPYNNDDRMVDGASNAQGPPVVHVIGIACGSVALLALLIGGIACHQQRDKEEDDNGADNDCMVEDCVITTTPPSDPDAPWNAKSPCWTTQASPQRTSSFGNRFVFGMRFNNYSR